MKQVVNLSCTSFILFWFLRHIFLIMVSGDPLFLYTVIIIILNCAELNTEYKQIRSRCEKLSIALSFNELMIFVMIFFMLVLLRRTSFYPPSKVYISVIYMVFNLLIFCKASGGSFHVLHQSCHLNLWTLLRPLSPCFHYVITLMHNCYYLGHAQSQS